MASGNGQTEPDYSFQQAFSDAMRESAQETQEEQQQVEALSPDGSTAQPDHDSAAPVEPVEPEWLSVAREAGFEVTESTDPAEVARQMASQLQEVRGQVEKLTPYAEYGQSLIPHAEQIREYFAKEQQPAEPEKDDKTEGWDEKQYFQELWKSPEWNEQYTFAVQNGMVQRNPETGIFEAVKGYETMVTPLLSGMNQAQQWQSKQWQDITRSNPYEHFYEKLSPAIQHLVDQRVNEMVSQKLASQKQETSVEQFERENSSWLYENGQYSEQGKKFVAQIERLQQAGVKDPAQLIELAKSLAGPPEQPEKPEQAAPAPPKPEKKEESFLQNAMQRAAHTPSSGAATVQSPSNPSPVEQNELDRMFVSAFQAAQGNA